MDTILLDVGGVLTLPHAPTVTRAVEPFGGITTRAALERAHDVARRAVEQHGEQAPDADDVFWATYCRTLEMAEADLPAATAAVQGAVRARRTPWGSVRSGARTGLEAVATRFGRRAIVSNASGRVREELADLGLCQQGPGPGTTVHAIVDSALVGVDKPDPAIFAIALERLGADPAGTVHVGDSAVADMAGARAAGIAGIHLDPHRLCGASDHHHVTALADVATLTG